MSGTGIGRRRFATVISVSGIVVFAILAWFGWSRFGTTVPVIQPATLASIGPAVASRPAPPTPPIDSAPTFDVVRVTPAGSAVLAGRAEPFAQVEVRDSAAPDTGAPIGQATADARGEWVIVPAAPLKEGARELTLVARSSSGVENKGDTSVVIAVPAPAADRTPEPAPAVAVLLPNQGQPRVLAQPGAAPRLGLGTVDYDEKGEIRFSGSAAPHAPVRVYVDNQPAGDSQADAAGQWTMVPHDAVAGGVHRLRVDQLTAAGRVQARVELPFQRTTLPPEALAQGRVVVQPGQSLWRLARSAYGSGVRYTVIYLANRDQIRDPRLIYPGQAFAVPSTPPS